MLILGNDEPPGEITTDKKIKTKKTVFNDNKKSRPDIKKAATFRLLPEI